MSGEKREFSVVGAMVNMLRLWEGWIKTGEPGK